MMDEARSNPLGMIKHWKTALSEAKDAIAWLAENSVIDPAHRGCRIFTRQLRCASDCSC
jgi:hypothetical protein